MFTQAYTGLGSDLSRTPLFTVFMVRCLHPPPPPTIWQLNDTEEFQRKNCASLCFFGLMFVRKEYQNMEKNPGKWNKRTLQRENNKLKALKLSCFNQFNASL